MLVATSYQCMDAATPSVLQTAFLQAQLCLQHRCPAPVSPSLTQDELAPGLGLIYNLSADVARSLLALNNLNYRISRGSWGQWERSTLCSRLKAPHGALTQRWLCPGGCLMSLQLFPPSHGGTSQDTAVQGPAEIQDGRQCQSHRFQHTPVGVNSFCSSAGALPRQFAAQLG